MVDMSLSALSPTQSGDARDNQPNSSAVWLANHQNRSWDDGALALVLARLVGSGCLPLSASLALAKEASASLRGQLDVENVWRDLFLSSFVDRASLSAPLRPVDVVADTGLASSLRRLLARHPPRGGLVVRDAIVGPNVMVDWETSFKVVGPPRSGKTWLVHHLCMGEVPTHLDMPAILGCDLRVAFVRLRDSSADGVCTRGRVRIWEPSGMSRQSKHSPSAWAAVLVVVNVADADAPHLAQLHLKSAAREARPGTVLVLCCTQVDRLLACSPKTPAIMAQLACVAADVGAELAYCSAATGEGVESAFCSTLAACQEGGSLKERTLPVLSQAAGTMSNSELIRALLHRR